MRRHAVIRADPRTPRTRRTSSRPPGQPRRNPPGRDERHALVSDRLDGSQGAVRQRTETASRFSFPAATAGSRSATGSRGGPDLEVVHGGGDRAGDDPARRSEGFADFVDPGPPFRSPAVGAGAIDVLHQPAAPAGPRYTPSLAPDSPSAWPTKFVVTNDGDAFSQPSSLAVSVKRLESRVPVPRGACEPRFADFTRDVPVLAPGGRFEMPTVELRVGSLSGKLHFPLALDVPDGAPRRRS